ncbi:MAG: ribosomal RNA small subunit methyltransferase A [Candidatus Firestonebacteria bacterium]|nr:ribosomal RNA small subunit methyltransferase A [Candidatus Firestonebacteria bacterium]
MQKSKLGQIFLKNHNIIDQIVDSIDIHSNETIIEIGPGNGILTEAIAKKNCNLIAIEIDKYLYNKLVKKFKPNSNVSIINADILNTSLHKIIGSKLSNKIKVVGNIPYYITSPILEYLILNKQLYKSSVIMLQKEVGERILSFPDSRKYGALTLFIQYNMIVEKITEVSKNEFYPKPKVDSMIIKLYPREKPFVKVENETLFFKIISTAFQKRRKMLHNALSIIETWGNNINVNDSLKIASIPSTLRAENLSIEDFARFCAVINNKIKGKL